MASYIQILTSTFKNKSAPNRPSPTYAPPPPPPAVIETPEPAVVIETPVPAVVIETPPPAAPEVVEPVEETPAPSDEKPEETEAPRENPDSEIV
jgi:hypothetical protein